MIENINNEVNEENNEKNTKLIDVSYHTQIPFRQFIDAPH